jgi:hypothetical protein
MLEDEGLVQEIHLHLQSIGKYMKAMLIVHYLNTPEMKECLDCKKNNQLGNGTMLDAENGLLVLT